LECYETDDTLGPKKLASLFNTGKDRIKRVMDKYQIVPRKKKRKYKYPGKANSLCQNLLAIIDIEKYEIIFSDIFEFRLKDGSKVYCCFTIRKYTRQILSFSYGYSMPAGLVIKTISTIQLVDVSDDLYVIFHSDQGKQYGAEATVEKIAEQGWTRSMSRAGTPTDNPIAERFVGIFKLAVVDRFKYETIGQFIIFSEKWLNFYNQTRPHESLTAPESKKQLSPNKFAEINNLKSVSYLVIENAQ
jgi:putative transposase